MALVEIRDPACAEGSPAPPLNVLLGLEGMALGGCPINALDLGRAMRERAHRVNVFAIEEDVRVSILPYAERCGFTINPLSARAGTASLARQIRGLADQTSADIVHVFAPWLGPAATIAAGAYQHRSAIVTNWMMENVSYAPQCTPLILGTQRLQREAQAGHRSRVWLMEPPVDIEKDRPDPDLGRRFRRKQGVEEGQVVAVIVSRLDLDLKAEGISYAIQALGQLDLPELQLAIVGDGNAFDQIQQEAKRLNRSLGRPAVVLTGALHDPRPAYDAADITLGMGGSSLRALAHGKPLIVLGQRGFARTFEPATSDYFYECGFYGDEQTKEPVSHLAMQLQALLDEDHRRALGEFGLAEVERRFGLVASTDKLETIYRTTLATRPSRRIRYADTARVLARAMAHDVRRRVRPTEARR
jgi:glycosyltransferase involved in cell wall biosynthesis